VAENEDGRGGHLETTGSNMTRKEWDLSERVTELQGQLTERVERERVRELEISSLRHELELRFGYNSALERNAVERQGHIDRLDAHIEQITNVFSAEMTRLSAEVATERHRLEQANLRIAAETARADEAVSALAAAEQTILAERQRISYRLVTRLTERRFAFGLLRWAAGVVAGRRQ
jgi:hypothetical protein